MALCSLVDTHLLLPAYMTFLLNSYKELIYRTQYILLLFCLWQVVLYIGKNIITFSRKMQQNTGTDV